MDKSSTYYRQVADGLEMVRQQHPLGTNLFLEIPVSDLSIPEIIHDLHPSKIRCFADGVGVQIGVGRGGFSINWGRDDMRANFNIWVLETDAEGFRKTIYFRTGI